jgi:signal transduction histidine kinase
MVIANSFTFLSYTVICLTLLTLAHRTRHNIAREWAWFVIGFALFIVACGSTHLMEVVTTWVPWFWVDATTNIVTAGLSAYVAVNLVNRVGTIGFSINDYAERLADTESQNRQMVDSLMAAQKLEDWSKTSAIVGHEIANPLEAIQSLLYLIRSASGATDEIIHLAQNASDEADRVLTISRSTLTFFRQGKVAERINLAHDADSIRLLLGTIMQRKELDLIIERSGDTFVEALPGEPRQVLLNLVRNALEASSGPGHSVRVSITGHPNGVEVVVADQGTGMEPSVLEKLFRFGVTTKGELGNGMGLWSARQILTRHGGTIKVHSELGVGTTFTLWWPRLFPAQSTDATSS